MNGLSLWATAGPNTRALFVRLACDADQHHDSRTTNQVACRLTVAQALELASWREVLS